jgi:hypothetical protein
VNDMKSVSHLLLLPAVAAFASCAEPSKTAAVEKPAATGSRFDAIGRVTLHVGQPCTPQIMFDFRRPRSTSAVWLAAPMRETTILTDAANRRSRVHVVGKWRRGGRTGCSYVDVATVDLPR